MKTDWLKKQTEKGKAQLSALLYKESLKEGGASKFKWACFAEPEEELAKLPVWQRTSTARLPITVDETEAAILPQSLIFDDELPYVDGWQKILAAIAKGRHHHVKPFLRDVIFQHHQSTNGRWNDGLGRYERWGVRSAEAWLALHDPKISESTWRRIKSELATLGLIKSRPYKWQGEKAVWIKPTEELSRIMFAPGYWETVKDKYVLAPKPKKPRGISATHKKIEAEHAALYERAVNHQLTFPGEKDHDILKKLHWDVWDTLTKPLALSKKYKKQPYVRKGSKRWKRLYEALSLCMF